MYNYTLSKINALRKGKSETQSQEEACLTFSHTEGNIKAILIASKEKLH